MQIDWFTVIAQGINFLVLMWLLKRFLYKPILNAIAAREKKIAEDLAEAKATKEEAEKEQEDFQHKNDLFDKHKAKLLSDTKREVAETREQLLKEAKAEVEDLRTKGKKTLQHEEEALSEEIITRTKKEIFAITAKVLHDLADVSLEERMNITFIKCLHNIAAKEKHALSVAFKASSSAIISSAFELSDNQQEEIKAAIKKTLGVEADKLKFKTAPELVSGIELSVSGHKLGWNIADYLTTLETSVDESMAENTKPKKKEPVHAAK